MKQFCLAVLLCLVAAAGHAQTSATGSITAANSACTSTSCVSLNLVNSQQGSSGAVGITVSANASSNTLQFEGTVDGTTWAAVNAYPLNSTTPATSTTSTGSWQINTAGLAAIRVRCSSFVSGTSTVTLQASTASARSGGSGGASTGTPNEIDVAAGVISLDPAIILPGSIQFGTTTTSVINGCGYSDVWIQHANGTCKNFPAASGAAADIATAISTAIAQATANGDKVNVPCAEAAFASAPSYPANSVGLTIVAPTNCPLGAVYPNGPSYTITNSAETSNSIVTLTVTVPSNNSLAIIANSIVHLSGLGVATWLNGFDVRISSTTSTTIVFTDPSSHGTSGSQADTGTALLDAQLGGALWTWADNGATTPCLLDFSTSTNMYAQGLTLYTTGQNAYGCQFGATVSGGVTGFTNGTIKDITAIGSSDDLFIQAASVSLNAHNFQAFSQWDTTKIAVTTPNINFYDSIMFTNGASTGCSGGSDSARNANVSAQGGVGGATHGSGTINFFNSQLKTQSCSSSAHSATTVLLTGGITVNIYGGNIQTTGGTTPAVLVNSATGGHSGIFHISADTTYPSGSLYGTANDDSSLFVPGGAVPQLVYSTPVTGMSMANSGTNTLLTGPTTMLASTLTTGTYSINFEVIPTAQGVGGSCNGGSLAISLGFTDDDTGVTTSLGVAAANENIAFSALSGAPSTGGLTISYSAGVLGATSQIFAGYPREIRIRTGTALTYQVFQVVNSNCTTPPVFSVRPRVTYLGY